MLTRIGWLAAEGIAILAVLLAPSASFSYRVFLDHDVDNDITTFDNEVVGPTTAPITIIVELEPGDAGEFIQFSIFWQCQDGFGDCAERFGDILHGDLFPPDSFPFMNTEILLCLSTGCECVANHGYATSIDPAAGPGHFALITEDFTRIGRDFGCFLHTFPRVDFQVSCPGCNYGPGDEAKTKMVIRDAAVGVEPAMDSSSWGRAKARYR